MPQTDKSDRPRPGNKRRRAAKAAAVAVALETIVMLARGYGVGTNVIVRCRDGHLFSTIWIPGASIKSLRFGLARFQYCPVGRHWSIVKPVKASALSDEDRLAASEHKDIRLP